MNRQSIQKVHALWVEKESAYVPDTETELGTMLATLAQDASVKMAHADLVALTTAIWEGRDGDVLGEPDNWAETDDVVEDGNECPECGEARMDWLICGADDTVKCATCGTVYALEAVEEG